MDPIIIKMIRDNAKSDSLKGTDVYRSTDPNAVITSIYIKKVAKVPPTIELQVS